MADIQRWDVGGDYGCGYELTDPQGDWVLYEDHKNIVDELLSRVEELKAEIIATEAMLSS